MFTKVNPEMHWFARSSSKDRRSTERYSAPHLAAYYWTGAHAPPHSVRDISSTGTYLVTEDRWHPGTLLMITLQKPVTAADTRSSRSIRVQSKVIRSGTMESASRSSFRALRIPAIGAPPSRGLTRMLS